MVLAVTSLTLPSMASTVEPTGIERGPVRFENACVPLTSTETRPETRETTTVRASLGATETRASAGGATISPTTSTAAAATGLTK